MWLLQQFSLSGLGAHYLLYLLSYFLQRKIIFHNPIFVTYRVTFLCVMQQYINLLGPFFSREKV
jgi:hypothetical protein